MRQAEKVGRYGTTRNLSVTLPAGLVDLVDQLAAERRAAAVRPDTRSGVIADLIEGGLALCNAERATNGDPLLVHQPEMEL